MEYATQIHATKLSHVFLLIVHYDENALTLLSYLANSMEAGSVDWELSSIATVFAVGRVAFSEPHECFESHVSERSHNLTQVCLLSNMIENR